MLLLAVLTVVVSCSQPGAVDRLTIVNPTPYDVEVQLGDGTGERWLVLGRAAHESSTTKESVTDMGETWVLRFHYGGHVVGEVTVERDELSRARWRIEVPSGVSDRMRELGFEPPPDD